MKMTITRKNALLYKIESCIDSASAISFFLQRILERKKSFKTLFSDKRFPEGNGNSTL